MKLQPKTMATRVARYILAAFLIVVSAPSLSANPNLTWLTYESEHFLVHYPEPLKMHVAKVVHLAEHSHKQLTPYFQWQPKNKTNVVLLDEVDQANGFASPMPNNTMTLYMQPPTQGELLLFDDWLRLLIHHEYTHILHIDKVMDVPAFLRHVFGRFIFLFPNALHPNWFQEGLATYLEGDADTHVGRGESDFFQMMMRQEVKSGIKPISRINTVNAHDWPFNSAYLYGVYFFKFMHDVYGEKAIHALVDNYSENLLPYRVSSNSEEVTGKNLEHLWYEFSEYLIGFFQPQFQRLNTQDYSDFSVLSDAHINYGAVEKGDGNTLWYSAVNEHTGTALFKYDLEKKEETYIEKLNSVGTLDVDGENRIVLSQLEYCDQYRVYYDLYIYEAGQSDLKRITKCGRYRMAKWLDENRIIALAYDKGLARLDLLDTDGELLNTVWQGLESQIVSSFDVNESAQIVASIKNAIEPWNVYLLEDTAGNSKSTEWAKPLVGMKHWRALTADTQLQIWPRWEANAVYFTQGNLAQFEIYKIESVKKGASLNKQRLSHNFSGIKQFTLLPDNKAAALRYDSDGFELVDLSLKPQKNLYEKKWRASESIVYDRKALTGVAYSPLSSLLPTYWMPVYLVNDDLSEVGFFTSGADVLSVHQYQLQLSYEKETQTPLINSHYIYDNRLIIGINQTMETTPYAVMPIDLPIYEYTSQWFVNVTLPQLGMQASYYPYVAYINHEARAVIADYKFSDFGLSDPSSTNDSWLAAGVLFDALSTSLSAGGYSEGFQFNSVIESADLADNSIYDGYVLNNQARYFVPLKNGHVLAQKLFVGLTVEGNSSFELGGSASEPYIGPGFQFKKRSLALRGYDDNLAELVDKNAASYSLEYRMPFDWLDAASMVPPVGFSGWSVRGFVDNGWLWSSEFDISDVYSGIGAELIMDGSLGYYLNIRLRMGVAKGLHSFGSDSFYVQLGGSF